RVDEVGQQMAAFPQVTHCYERQTSARWPRFNIFTMIHAKTVAENRKTLASISDETGIEEYEVLSTVREFKKERVRYLV
ncbi:MAG: Lrp/AsnC family transcriptional regulator, partial [Dehalococcoidia bacterium]|nr:Lrp/AsnC family transcriptional regulator [Dehalococcoidia bacterium]